MRLTVTSECDRGLFPRRSSVAYSRGVGGGSTPPPHDRTDENFQHRI
jgi:hypothetical protein